MNINRNIIFFDGECNFCNSTVDLIIKNDKKKYFSYSWLQSNYAKKKLGQKAKHMSTIILVHNQKMYTKSDAIFEILKNLSGPINILYIFKFFPKIVRNFVYDIIAKNRYSIFGKKDECEIPSKEKRDLFFL